MKNILLIITLFVSWNTFAVEKVWYCDPKANAGLTFKDSSYEITRFKNDRITIQQDGSKLIFSETRGTSFNFDKDECKYFISKVGINCTDDNGTKSFSLHTLTGKATSSSSFGWLAHPSYGADDMNVTAWKCESF
jgi:hypothetical protein